MFRSFFFLLNLHLCSAGARQFCLAGVQEDPPNLLLQLEVVCADKAASLSILYLLLHCWAYCLPGLSAAPTSVCPYLFGVFLVW